MARQEYAYIGSGRILARRRGTNEPFRELGNCSALALAVEQETKRLRDFRTSGGGTYAQVDRITSVSMSVTAHDLSPDNIALALYGTTAAVAGSAVVDEEHATFKGGYIVPNLPFTPATIVVKNTAGTTTYVAGTDYVVQYGAVWIPATSGIADAADVDTPNVKVSYTGKAGDLVQALTASAQEMELKFLGLNEAASGKEVRVDIWRGQFGATQNLSLIGDDFASLEMPGAVLPDTSKTGGTSQYFQTFIEE